jgi:hypothetical protein
VSSYLKHGRWESLLSRSTVLGLLERVSDSNLSPLPSVGVSGHTLHGGFGFSSHTHGLALDAAVGATVVLANGTVVETSKTVNPSLFWALRGAGSNFGVVVSWSFQTFSVPRVVTAFEINLPQWRSNATNLAAGFSNLQDWLLAGGMPRELNMRILANGFTFRLEGLYHGDKAGFWSAITPLLPLLGTNVNATNVRELDWMSGFRAFANAFVIDTKRPHREQETFYTKSLVTGALPADVLRNVATYWVNAARTASGRSWYVIIDMYGGPNSAITAVPKDETSYAFRDPKKHLFLYQFNDSIFFGSYPANGFSFLDNWIKAFTDGLSEDEWGMYINYADPRLDRDTAQEVYYRDSLPRLRQLKKELDPNEVFYYPQAIKPAEF